MMSLKVRTIIITGITSFLITGCASYFYSDIPDPATANAEVQAMDSQSYAEKLQRMVDRIFPKSDTQIVTDHFNVLVIGQVDSQDTKDGISDLIKQQSLTKEVYNYTTISAKPSYNTSSSMISDVKDRLSKEPDIDSNKITVAYADSVVYLMGLNIGDLTHLARAIRGVEALDGVKKVVNLTQMGKLDYYSGK